MGFVDSQEGTDCGGQGSPYSWKFLTRRKMVDSHVKNNNNSHGVQLAKELTVPHLMAIGNSFFSYLLLLWVQVIFNHVFHQGQ